MQADGTPANLTGGSAPELHGLHAVVTGASSGIGRAIAMALARGGASLVLHTRRSLEGARAAAAEIDALPGRDAVPKTAILAADLAVPGAADALVRSAYAARERIDVWVNNAGADVLTGAGAELGYLEKLDLLWTIDVRATLLLTRAVGERMRRAGGGAILLMGWDRAESGMEGDSGELFGATKGAIMAFTRAAARTLAPEVRVNCLAPGWIKTAWGREASPRWQERVRRETPLGRWGTPEDVAHLARFLASPAAAYITGQVLRVNGGAVC